MHVALMDPDPKIHAQFQIALWQDRLDIFSNSSVFLNRIYEQFFDLICVDFHLPKICGQHLGHFVRLSPLNAHCPIIYLFHWSDSLFEIFSTHPYAILQKPFTPSDLLILINRLAHPPLAHALKIKSGHSPIYVAYRDILFLESQASKVCVHSRNQDHYVYAKLSDFDLPDCFVRIHQSFIVNLHYVVALEKALVWLINGQSLPISQRYRPKMRNLAMQLELR